MKLLGSVLVFGTLLGLVGAFVVGPVVIVVVALGVMGYGWLVSDLDRRYSGGCAGSVQAGEQRATGVGDVVGQGDS